ncbi:MAG TPA: aminotransferase class I/II-fold pyridoxal phosphate-dependent enzyme [Myxococcales bacterium]|nr:aminotransferase class I/II-fold pyridoxal phosphate-dependent enzyme [Myxococcales bacterium]
MNQIEVFSRRRFAGIAGAGIATAALRPLLATTQVRPTPSIVRLSANENPYGPSQAALRAVRDALSVAWRYPDESVQDLIADLAALHGVPKEWFVVGDGSSEILKLAASAFTGTTRKLVTAEPTFEAIAKHAEVQGAEVLSVPLDRSYAHDLARMSVSGAGLVYLCNPNNPTGTITPKAKVRAFLDSLPQSVMLLVDEAYHHYADSPDYESVVPLVKTHPNLIVARTFSKIYGMAGLRLGYAVAQPDVAKKLSTHAAWDSVNALAIAAGRASLKDTAYVTEGQRRNRATRTQLTQTLHGMGYEVIPTQTNFVMIQTGRDVRPVIDALRDRGVEVGRLFPALPQHLRVTIGTPPQMKRFLDAFAATMT